ncbi:MAG: T9SS type A sorting domain-containing protein, partial [Tannerella sp.]|nr:T9SS type A sorting domain-containing protein [Tannerella sp.]
GVKHYVQGHDDFTFTLTFAGGEPLKVTATGFYSQRPEELDWTENLGDGTFRYLLPEVTEPWTITVSSDPASKEVSNELITGRRVWTYANTLYIQSDKAVHANIYTLSGSLLKQLNVSAGTTGQQLERGVYIVEIEGSRYKVIVK